MFILKYILKISCLIALSCLLLSCGGETEPPENQPVRQKISVSAPAPQPPAEPAPASKPAPAASQTTAPGVPDTAQAPPTPAPGVDVEAPDAAPREQPPGEAVHEDAGEAAGEIQLESVPSLTTADLDNLEMPAGEEDKIEEGERIDPFSPLFREEKAPVLQTMSPKKPERRIPLTPLEKVALSQLTLVGIVQSPDGNLALVEEATGKGYVVRRGTYIGVNSGQIVDIQKDRLIIEEEIEDSLGKVTITKRELFLQKPAGEI